MVKGILWRFLFELANFWCWLSGGRGATVKYFAFGANMDPRILARRRIHARHSQDLVLRDYELNFSTPGPYAGMGFASVEAKAGERAYGRLHTISKIDALRLDFYEMVPVFGYYKRVWVEQDGERFFFYQTTMPREGLKPTAKYIDKICTGYECAAHVPKEYIQSIRSREVLLERTFSTDLQFSFPIWNRLPAPLAAFMRSYDRRAVAFFFKYLYDRSFFERFLRHHK